MSAKFQRPEGDYAGRSDTANRTKYQDDAAAVPKRAISSCKMDGDFNYLIDAVNQTWEAVSVISGGADIGATLPDMLGHDGKYLTTNGLEPVWTSLPAPVIADKSVTLAKLANVTGPCVVGAASDGVVSNIGLSSAFSIANGTLQLVASGVPTGVVSPFAGAIAPDGWLLCSGAAVSRTDFAALFAVIGTTYGAGNGTTTFNLPDLRGRSVFGRDSMGGTAASRITSAVCGISGGTLGASGGDQRSQRHNHTITDPGHRHNQQAENIPQIGSAGEGDSVSGAYFSKNLATNKAVLTLANTTGISLAEYGAGESQNMPPAMIMNWMIKA